MSYRDGILTYIRNLIGWGENPCSKRDRADDGLFDDEVPAYKRHKLSKTNYPDMSFKDARDIEEPKSKPKVCYVPIQVEPGHPSTSTPNEMGAKFSRVRAVPIQVMKKIENGPSSPTRKPRMHTPVRPLSHVVEVDDDDDEEEPQIWVQAKSGTKKMPKIYIDLDEEDDDSNSNENDDEVQFVKRITRPPPRQPHKYFESEVPIYKKLSRKVNDRNSMSPKTLNKLSGISKSYKKAPISRWMTPNLPRNRFLALNGNTRSTMAEVFNLDEKKNYQELIKKVADSVKPSKIGRSFGFINLSEEAESFRNTQRSQRRALNELNLVEKGLLAEKENDSTKEYNPITVASINSSDSEVEVIQSESTSTTSSSRIDPINTLRDSFRDRAVTSTDWLSKLDSKYKKKKQLTQEKLKDAKRESDIISKVNSEQKIAQLEHKLKHELCLPECIYEEPQPTVELPALTPEQEKLVNRALGPGPPGMLLIEKFNLRIHKRDLQTLAGLNWLNDEVINFYMNLLMQRCEERADLPRVYAANTFFYPKLMQGGQAGLRRWTRKVDIFAHDLMIVPVHLGVHWCLSIVDFRAKTVAYLDSMGGPNRACLDALMHYLRDEHKDKKGQPFDDSGWKSHSLKDIPQQMNGSDCGMFACTFAEFSARDAPYSFTQAHMPYLRRKMALEIITGKLLL